jgi:hypothetical protein
MPYFRYRLFFKDGSEAGDATYAALIKPDEIIHVNGGHKLRVVAVVPVDEDSSSYTGFLEVEAA